MGGLLCPVVCAIQRLWRRFACLVLALGLILTLVSRDAIPPSQYFFYRLGMIVAGYQFNLTAWEWQSVADKARQMLAREAGTLSPSEQEARVRAFFALTQRIQEVEGELERVYSAPPRDRGMEALTLQKELDALRGQQVREQGVVEAILEAQVREVLREEGFAVGSVVWPFVAFRLAQPPTYLIVSPREVISRRATAELLPSLGLAERESLEGTIDDALGVSSLVDDLGGLSAFPTIVLFTSSLLYTVDTVAHEWAHLYLFFTPLGSRYGESGDLTTMNETAASVVGEEVARKVMLHHYPDLAPPPAVLPDEDASSLMLPGEESAFDYNRVMRQTRLQVDRLLADGRVTEASTYMESQRQLLVEHGYYLRKLNQAYFAFHGAYATSPASVDPIGPQMRRLRLSSPSLRAFLESVSEMRGYADLQRSLHQLGDG